MLLHSKLENNTLLDDKTCQNDEMLKFVLDLIFPKFCVGCGRFYTFLCNSCYQQINFYPLKVTPNLENIFLEEIIVMAKYEGVLKKLVTTLKYKSVKDISLVLAELIFLTTDIPEVEIITSVPLHHQRKKNRGFNQSSEIAKELSRLLRKPYLKLLRKTKHSKPQAKINDRDKRLTQLKNNFELYQQINSNSILIIDDVTTTGTTLNECARVLKKNGVKKIYGLVVAHGN